MKCRLPLILAAALAACAAAPSVGSGSRAKQTAVQSRGAIHYALEIPEPTQQWVHVTMTLAQPRGRRTQVAMPAWAPGSYLIRDFARHVDGIVAEDLRGNPLPLQRIDKQTWQVEHGRSGFRVRYRVFADEPGVRTSHVDEHRAILNGPTLFLYPVGQTNRPIELDVRLVPGWQAHTALATTTASSEYARFTASDYDELVDSPLILGQPAVRRFSVATTAIDLVFIGHQDTTADIDRIATDIERIVTAFATMMGDLPLERYVFLLIADESGDGGLEHANSSLLRVARDLFSDPRGYRRLANLAAHEFFHLWNVKRLRDAALRPYDYARENHSELLWFHEGLTETMEQQALLRAGIIDPDVYLGELAAGFTGYLRKPGRNHLPLRQLSYEAWIKAYKPSPSHGNTLISYYEKGDFLGLCLDLELRLRSAKHGRDGSLAGLFRRLMSSHGHGRGLTYADIITAASAEAGEDMAEFFRNYVEGVRELPLPQLLAQVGVNVTSTAPTSADIGIVVGADRSVQNIIPGAPAAAAGLMLGDEVVAVGGLRVRTSDEATTRIRALPPDQPVEVAVFRAGRLVVRSVTPRLDPHPTLRFEAVPEAQLSAQVRQLRSAWLASPPRDPPPS